MRRRAGDHRPSQVAGRLDTGICRRVPGGNAAFLATIIPFIEAEIIAKAFNAARNDHSVASNDDTDQTQPNLNSGSSSA